MASLSGKKKTKPKPLTDTVALDAIVAPDVTDEVAYNAALVMAGIASEREDPPCGLSNVLDALAIREMSRDYKTSQKKIL